MKNFKGKVAVITGVGSGMGKELAIQLAAKGAKLALNDWNDENLQATLDIVKQSGGTAIAKQYDVANRIDVYAFKDEVLEMFGQVDIVINNAGIGIPDYSIEKVPYDEFEKVININMWGVIYGTKAYLPHLLTRPEGVIANTSSIFGIIGCPAQSAYSTSKFAVKGFTEALNVELTIQKSNVRALSIHPGRILTNIVRNIEFKSETITAQEKAAIAKSFDEGGDSTTAAEAAAQIIQAIQEKAPKLLIGTDAKDVDQIVRSTPGNYTIAALKRLGTK